MFEIKKKIVHKIIRLPQNKKVQLFLAVMFSLLVFATIPAYAWFNYHREIARLERIESPDMLYITAADREDKINLKMDSIDVNAKWGTNQESFATSKYFVFSVAGDYVTNYSLQLAHTKNNNYKYEIFEAVGTVNNSDVNNLVVERDYVIYDRMGNLPTDLPTINSKYGDVEEHPKIYYKIKKDSNGTEISLNAGNTYVITPANETEGTPEVTISFDGHYLNMDSESGASEYYKTADSTGTYHDKTYDYDQVEVHSEPLYWQVTDIPVDLDNGEKQPFYHEYILKVSWDGSANLTNLSKYKDTDIVYITVSVR